MGVVPPRFSSIPIPTGFGVLREMRVAADLAAGLLHLPAALAAPRRRRAEPVLLLPGLHAGDTSMWPLRSFLRRLGWDARGWGLGINGGDAPGLLPRVIERAESIAAAHGRRLRLVGWSMGGFLAREVARDRPDLVAHVTTLGTPVVGGPRYTALAGLFLRRGYDLDAVEAECEARARRPIAAPITAIYSRRDGVVAWQACVDRISHRVEHVEVDSTHAGLGFDLRVWRIVADRLARPRRARAATSRRAPARTA
jgi:pimeloyl-ACP methyl ester carboxylesterase